MLFIYIHNLISIYQRPSAKELLKFPFIKKAKKTSCLIELIEKFKQFKVSGQSDSDSEESDSYVLS